MRTTALLAGIVLAALVRSQPAWGDELATGTPATLLAIDDTFVTGLTQPTAVAVLPDGRLVITERLGRVRVRTVAGALVEAGTFSVNSAPPEQGLLNVVAHPSFATNRLLFFYYSRSDAAGGTEMNRHRVVTVELGADNRLVMATEDVIVENLRGPAVHNGGALGILGDKLFVGVGDTGGNGTGAHPSSQRVQVWFGTCLTNAHGKVLRVNLDGSIPSDNPLVGDQVTACGATTDNEPTTKGTAYGAIWAWGFRNPWRLYPDPKTGNVWVGDVGEVTYEEIDVIPKAGGLHFGWPFREGNEGLPATRCTSITPNAGNCTDPAYFCEHSGGPMNNANVPDECGSITGGVILDGCEWPAQLEGRYVFGDYESKYLWTLALNAARTGVTGARQALGLLDVGPVHFVEGGGALYVVAHSGAGHITRIAPKAPEAACTGTGTGGSGAGSGGTGVGGATAEAGAGGAAEADAGESSGGAAGAGGGSPSGGRPSSTAGSAEPRGGSGGRAAGGVPASAGEAGSSAGSSPAGGEGSKKSSGCGCSFADRDRGALAALAGGLGAAAYLLRRRRRNG